MAKIRISFCTEDGELLSQAIVEVDPGLRAPRFSRDDRAEIDMMLDEAANIIAARARMAEREG
jgi:hypothetical protein